MIFELALDYILHLDFTDDPNYQFMIILFSKLGEEPERCNITASFEGI